MGGKFLLSAAVLASALMMCPLATAGDEPAPVSAPAEPPAMHAAVGPEVQEPVEPWIHHSMPGCMKEKILTAFQIAVERVREVPECRDLFTKLEADGVEMLTSTLYFPASPFYQTSRCRHAFALTEVGEPTTWVFRKVTAHCEERVAVALLHEALHHAGLTEQPTDPTAMTAREIDGMVGDACGRKSLKRELTARLER